MRRIEIVAVLSMSLFKCPPVPKASTGVENPSWEPALALMQAMQGMPPPPSLPPVQEYMGQYREPHIKHREIISPNLLTTIQRSHLLLREIGGYWWMGVESAQEATAKLGDTFLCRREHFDYTMIVENPTEDEKQTLTYEEHAVTKKMVYCRSHWYTIEYGSTYEGDGRWTRYTVAYLKGDESPYPFKHDCRPEHHKHPPCYPFKFDYPSE